MAIKKEQKIKLGIALKEIFKVDNEGITLKELGYREALYEVLRQMDLYYESGGEKGIGTIPELERFIRRKLIERIEEED